MGFYSLSQLQNDSDLISLHCDHAWGKIIGKAKENWATYHTSHNDPEGFKIIISDVDLFWKVYDQLPSEKDPASFLEHHYLDSGTSGLQGFIVRRIESGEKLNEAIETFPRFYSAIRNNTLRLASVESAVRTEMRKFKTIYADAEFPDVYIVVGRFSSGGTATSEGLVLGAELFTEGHGIPLVELGDWQRSVIDTAAPLPNTIAHELMHFQ